MSYISGYDMPDSIPKHTAIILAAGQSRRMGEVNKLLCKWRGKMLLHHVCEAALTSNCDNTIVVSGHQRQQIAAALKKPGLCQLLLAHNKDYATGMASSIITGIEMAKKIESDAVIVMLGDMPGVTSAMIDKIIDTARSSAPDAIIVSTCDKKRGNPVLWKKHYFDELLMLKGDIGARQILNHYQDKIVEVELGQMTRFDLDTPQAFDEAN